MTAWIKRDKNSGPASYRYECWCFGTLTARFTPTPLLVGYVALVGCRWTAFTWTGRKLDDFALGSEAQKAVIDWNRANPRRRRALWQAFSDPLLDRGASEAPGTHHQGGTA